VTVKPGELGGVPVTDITVDGVEPRYVVLYFHGGVYVLSCRRRDGRTGHVGGHPWGTAGLPGHGPLLDEAIAALDSAGQFLTARLTGAHA
jgi:hypothetical protein